MNDDRSFFVAEDGSSSTTDTAPRLGYVARTCFDCHSEWTLGQSDCPKCHSTAFTEEYVPAIPFTTRVAERLKPKKPVPRATPAQLAAVRAIGATVINLLADLRSLDQELIEAVRADVEELQWPQALVHRAVSITGDVSTRNIDGLSLSLEALATYLTIAIKTIEDKPK